jgi:hypothetical protein
VPRSVDVIVESPASVDKILSTFGDEVYWRARLAEFNGGTARLDDLTTDGDGTVAIALRLGLVRDRLPKVVTQLHSGDLEMLRNETWRWADEGQVRGDLEVTIPGTPLTVIGQAQLAPANTGSRLTYTATVKVGVPLVGGKIESYICGQTVGEVNKLQNFTNKWIAENV